MIRKVFTGVMDEYKSFWLGKRMAFKIEVLSQVQLNSNEFILSNDPGP